LEWVFLRVKTRHNICYRRFVRGPGV
jgi:hypothetical protein